MFKKEILVPRGIRYLSENNWFNFSNFPDRCIINKQIPGCGFTEYCLTGPECVILCSPRKLLLKNKKDQSGDRVYLVINESESDLNIDFNLEKQSRGKESIISKNDRLGDLNKNSIDISSSKYKKIYYGISKYIESCYLKSMPIKILVTYDSYHLVVDIIQKIDISLFSKFYTIVDEFQSILHDARFKSNTELSFLTQLNRSNKTFFVSATPMLEEYLDMLKEFKDLPYYVFNWSSEDITRVIKPKLDICKMRSINSKAKEIIDKYLNKDFDSIVIKNGDSSRVVVNKEAVFYVNSVNHILNIIKTNRLTSDQVNILCADTEENKKKIISKLGKDFSIGSIPLKGSIHKMFTFCTRTVYLGADFYSTCAKTYIFSDSNSDCLAVDISEDLPQILGRQRLDENPWKNCANFYYKTTADYNKMSEEDFRKLINKKDLETENKIKAFNEAISQVNKDTIVNVYQKVTRLFSYKDDYVAVDESLDFIPEVGVSVVKKPVINMLVRVNELRSYRIQQIDYADRFSVFSSMNNKFSDENVYDTNKLVMDFMRIYESKTTIVDRLRLLCENDFSSNEINIILSQLVDSDVVKSYYLSLGPVRLKELGYNITLIKKDLGISIFSPEILINSIYSNFHVGDKIKLSVLKEKLRDIYNSISYEKTPKAIDILDFFEVREFKEVGVIGGIKKRFRGYELIKSFELEMRTKLNKLNN